MLPIQLTIFLQQKVSNLYEVRDKISEGVSSDLDKIEILPGALLAKDLCNEENLLMYAAAMGKKDWFKHITRKIREQVGGSMCERDLMFPSLVRWHITFLYVGFEYVHGLIRTFEIVDIFL